MRNGNRPRSALARIGADPVSRRRFFAVSGAGGASALLVACGDDDEETTTTGATGMEGMSDQFGEGDLGIVNYALTLEYLEAEFYDQVARSGLFSGDQQALIETFGQQEQDHVDALTKTARQLGQPAKAPKTEFPIEDADQVLELAATVENLGAAAYLGAAPSIEDAAILEAALSIHSVEGRHAAALNTLLGDSFVPDGAFAEPADMQTVLDEVQPFITG